MSSIKGTHLDVRFSRVVDGDTIRVFLPGQAEDESLRILALDTEESNAGGSKPVTPWGHEAKKRAIGFFENADQVTIEFPGNDDVDTCIRKHRGNFGRLLVFVYRDSVDFQETMIREGYSPYFMKYGNAVFGEHHRRYQNAEIEAQRKHIGVWNQTEVNGSVKRNYATLGTWWKLRAHVIDQYRAIKADFDNLFNTRLDYEILKQVAEREGRATVFTELGSIRRVGGSHGLISNRSEDRPFSLFIPDIDSDAGQEILNYLTNRYISDGEDNPRRSYAYVTGQLSAFRNDPQIVISSADQITDDMPTSDPDAAGAVRIASLLPDPAGPDAGNERVTLANDGSQSTSLEGWRLEDRARQMHRLSGEIPGKQIIEIPLPPGAMPLNNAGDEVRLIDSEGTLRHRISYTAADVRAGQEIQFT